MTPTLRSSKLVKVLEARARKDVHAAALFGILQPIADDLSPLLEFIRHSFPAYPRHGIDHSLRILERIGGILSQAALNALSSNELFCVILAALFHDAGMVAPESKKQNDPAIRSVHHERSAELFLRYFSDRIPLLANNRVAQVIAFTIECHGLNWDQMQSNPQFLKNETLDGQPIRPSVLALLLRIGDLLDLDSDRTSEVCLSFCASWYSTPESLDHNDRHRHVTHFYYDENKIEVEVECPTRAQYEIWFSWLEYLRMDIERANTYVFRDSLIVFRLPVPILKCIPSKDARFELWPLRFEIDESGTLWDLISKSIYTGKHDFLRELIQNSIDACLRRIYDDPKGLLPSPSPREWSLAGLSPTVFVISDEEERTIIVGDNGVGMDRQAIKNFLFRVAGSGMKGFSEGRPFSFPSIATFGIGFISVLTRASNLRLVTRPALPDTITDGLSIQLDANLRDAIVEKEPSCQKGTTIVLRVRAREYVFGIEEYLKETFRYPSVEICFINWSNVKGLASIIKNNNLKARGDDFNAAENLIKQHSIDIGSLLTTTKRFADSARAAIVAENDYRRREPAEDLPPLPYIADPIVKIVSDKPQRLPTSTSWCFFLDDKTATVAKGFKIKAIKAGEIRTAKLIVVPVQFNDPINGIEWRSLHSFLVARGGVTKHISFIRTEELGSRSFVMPSDLLDDPDSYYEEIMDQAEGQYEEDPFDLVELMQQRYEKHKRDYEVEEPPSGFHGPQLTSNRDDIRRYPDVDYGVLGRLDHEDNDSLFDVPFLGASEGQRAFDWFRGHYNAVYQDGIRLPISIGDIAPIGTVAGVANFVANARLSYNVSRNAIDQSEDRLRAWRSGVGFLILKQVATAVVETLKTLEIEYSWEDLWTGHKVGALSRLISWSNLESLARK